MLNRTETFDGGFVAVHAGLNTDTAASLPANGRPEKIFVVDDEYFARDAITALLRDEGWDVQAFASCEDFLSIYKPEPNTCLLLDIHLPGIGGLELLQRMGAQGDGPPVIAVSGSSGIADAVQSIKQGAMDFIEKPVRRDLLVASVKRALARSRETARICASRDAALGRLGGLTHRQHEIMDLVLAGHPSKNIAADLGISQRTVESHRAAIMHRTGAHSIPALARLVMCHQCTADA